MKELDFLYPDNRIIFTNGCFDLLHYGHVSFLQACKRLGGTLVVGLNSDSSVKRLKGKYRPIISEKYRMEMLLALDCVDEVILFGDDTPVGLIEMLKPDIYVKSSEYKDINLPEFHAVKKYGGKILIIEPTEEMKQFSTTKIVDSVFRKEYERRLGINHDDSRRQYY